MTTRRALLAGLAAAPLASRASRAWAAAPYDAVVGQGGHGSVAEAVAAAPDSGERPFRILVRRGTWHEKLDVKKPNIHLIGEDRAASVLTFDAYSGKAKPDGSGNYGTSGSASVTVTAPGFSARDLTITNGFDYLANPAANGAQAVALSLSGQSDRALIERVTIVGHQDTLLTNAGRALFRDCHVAGSVDFIFGAGRVLFETCEIRSRLRPGAKLQGYIAAPSTKRAQPIGLVFRDCRLTGDPGMPKGSVFLGRPWRAGGDPDRQGHTAYIGCWMGAHIVPDGWAAMGFKAPNGTPLMLRPEEARFGEYGSRGPGASRARRQLTAAQAAALTPAAVLDGWRP